jgi:hypothetical protein
MKGSTRRDDLVSDWGTAVKTCECNWRDLIEMAKSTKAEVTSKVYMANK